MSRLARSCMSARRGATSGSSASGFRNGRNAAIDRGCCKRSSSFSGRSDLQNVQDCKRRRVSMQTSPQPSALTHKARQDTKRHHRCICRRSSRPRGFAPTFWIGGQVARPGVRGGATHVSLPFGPGSRVNRNAHQLRQICRFRGAARGPNQCSDVSPKSVGDALQCRSKTR